MLQDMRSAEPDQCVDTDQTRGLVYLELAEPVVAEFSHPLQVMRHVLGYAVTR